VTIPLVLMEACALLLKEHDSWGFAIRALVLLNFDLSTGQDTLSNLVTFELDSPVVVFVAHAENVLDLFTILLGKTFLDSLLRINE
jgi:hypothetical protein